MSLVPGFFQVPPSRMRYWAAMSTLNAPSRTMSSTMPGEDPLQLDLSGGEQMMQVPTLGRARPALAAASAGRPSRAR